MQIKSYIYPAHNIKQTDYLIRIMDIYNTNHRTVIVFSTHFLTCFIKIKFIE